MLADAADPLKAGPTAAYMKTDTPFYGVQKAGRTPILRAVMRDFPPEGLDGYLDAVSALWVLPHREEKYVALGYARAFDEYIESASLPLYRRMIIEGAWWDFVDEIASKLVGRLVAKERVNVAPKVRSWIRDDDLWLRRTSIICQLGHKTETDIELLSDACVANLGDPDFFIRKAIGWALREYAKTDPEWVRAFVRVHREELAALSYREATKHL
jgi:3-methyladenine DNA glycosylase AlkD